MDKSKFQLLRLSRKLLTDTSQFLGLSGMGFFSSSLMQTIAATGDSSSILKVRRKKNNRYNVPLDCLYFTIVNLDTKVVSEGICLCKGKLNTVTCADLISIINYTSDKAVESNSRYYAKFDYYEHAQEGIEC